jgi:hypothetical protein
VTKKRCVEARRQHGPTPDNKCSELGACGTLPPGDGQAILSVWAGGHVAPGPQAAPAARRATSQS